VIGLIRARWRVLVLGGLVVGTLDLLDAVVFFGIRNGVRPTRILQSIAAGLLGRASFEGGVRTALLGALLHYFIAFAIVVTFAAASRLIPALARRPLVTGPIYGVGVWLFMNFVVLPLSAAGRGPFVPASVANGLFIHVVGVGIPAALAARAALRVHP